MFRLFSSRTGLTRSVFVAAVLYGLLAPGLFAQNTATLIGTVSDASNAVVPGATVLLKSQLSGDTRRTITNGEGYFTVSAVQPGDYTLTVQAQGFKAYDQKDLHFDAGDKRNVDVSLEVGATTETVEVTAEAAEITPVDSGEKSSTISAKQLQDIAIVGSNAAEFIKILPGMAITGGTQNGASYNGEIHGTGSGPVGSFAANGQRTGAIDITSDGCPHHRPRLQLRPSRRSER
jgi:hypothetical protein